MIRDMDLIRDLLFQIEKADWGFVDGLKTEDDGGIIQYHLKLMYEAGLIDGQVSRGTARRALNQKMDLDMDYVISCRPWSLTWDGHEYLDTIRDPGVWDDVQSSARKIGSFGIETIKALAKGYIKVKIKQHTGIET